MRPNLPVLTIAVSAILSGCMRVPMPMVRSNPDRPDSTEFQTLEALLRKTGTVRMLIVHGMGPKRIGYSTAFQGGTAMRLRLNPRPTCSLLDTMVNAYGSRSFVHRCAYSNGAGQELVTYEVTWSELTQHFDTLLINYDWQKYGYQRVALNRYIKSETIDQSFSDAVAYTGNFGPMLRSAVKRGICALMLDASPTFENGGCTFSPARLSARESASPIVVVSHSLGSMMVWETLTEMAKPAAVGIDSTTGDRPAAAHFIRRLETMVFLANQLPLLTFARLAEAPDRGSPVSLLTRGSMAFHAAPRGFAIVALSDPNDLLTFPLEAGWKENLRMPGWDPLESTCRHASLSIL